MRVLLAALALLPLLAAPAAAQLPAGACGAASLGLTPVEVEAQAGSTAVLDGTVQNRGSRAGNALITVQVPAGWQATVEPDQLPVAAGAIQAFAVRVVVPANATARGEVTVRATLACSAIPIDRAEAGPVTSTVTPTAAPTGLGARINALVATYGVPALGFLAVGAVGAAAAAGAVRARGSIHARAPEPVRSLRPGRGTSFPIALENRDRKADTVRFEVGKVPPGWAAFTAVPEVNLAAGERRTLWLMVRAPPDAAEGSHADIPVTVRSDARPGRGRSLRVRAEVSSQAEGQAPAESGIRP